MAVSSIVCIGSSSQDIFFPTDEGMLIDTPEDLTSKQKIAFEVGGKYRVNDRYEAVGGVAANVAQGLAKLGHPVSCYTKVGGDALGEWIRKEFEKARVSTDRLFVDAAVRTDLSAIVVMEQSGERTIFHNRDANEMLEIIEEKLVPAEWFFVSALNGPWEANLNKIMAIARTHAIRLAYNPGQHNIRENPGLVKEMIGLSEILVLNKDEAIEILLEKNGTPFDEHESALIRELHALGAKVIGLTDGKRGAWASDGTTIFHVPGGKNIRTVDATGGGDAFGSGFLGAHLFGKKSDEALRWGATNAQSVIGKYGAAEGLLDRETLEDSARCLEAARQVGE